jgi:hypothetical protein
MRDAIFVSYAHADQGWFEELQAALGEWQGNLRIDVWTDRRIEPGARWEGEIQEALDTAAAAVLVLSPHFFASEFIRTKELPALTGAARVGDLRLLPVVVEAGGGEELLGEFQAINDAGRPLAAMDEAGRKAVWQRLGECLREVGAGVTEEAHIAAERVRLERDLDAVPDVAHVLEKMVRAEADPVFEADERMRENTLLFLEGQRIQAATTWLLEEMRRTANPHRSKAIVRLMEELSLKNEMALKRATELTREFSTDTLRMLTEAKERDGQAE